MDVDSQGNFNTGDGIIISLIDWVKLGYPILNAGRWEDRELLISILLRTRLLFNHKFQERISLDISSSSSVMILPDFFCILGEPEQCMYVIPSENMIISLFIENFLFGFINPSLNLFNEITYCIPIIRNECR